jgi:hypothetical protein
MIFIFVLEAYTYCAKCNLTYQGNYFLPFFHVWLAIWHVLGRKHKITKADNGKFLVILIPGLLSVG